MRIPTRTVGIALSALLMSPVATHAAGGEQWEYSMSILMPDGSSTPMNTLKACRSAAAALMPAPQPNCKVEDFKSSGNKASYRLVCGPPQSMTMTGEVTRNGDTSIGTVRIRQNGQDMVMKQSSRKLGSCADPID
jgi:Protein of unknown function (DUF3617)